MQCHMIGISWATEKLCDLPEEEPGQMAQLCDVNLLLHTSVSTPELSRALKSCGVIIISEHDLLPSMLHALMSTLR